MLLSGFVSGKSLVESHYCLKSHYCLIIERTSITIFARDALNLENYC